LTDTDKKAHRKPQSSKKEAVVDLSFKQKYIIVLEKYSWCLEAELRRKMTEKKVVFLIPWKSWYPKFV